MASEIKIRDARMEDMTLITKGVMAAAHMNDFPAHSEYDDEFAAICSREDTLYSYRHTRILTVDGEPAGCMISYPGDIYTSAREVTFRMFTDLPEDIIAGTGTEAFPGEWYLDSLAIIPEYRKNGYGKLLMQDAIATGLAHGYSRFSLIVEKGNKVLEGFYSSLGFGLAEDITFFGEPYRRMILTK